VRGPPFIEAFFIIFPLLVFFSSIPLFEKTLWHVALLAFYFIYFSSYFPPLQLVFVALYLLDSSGRSPPAAAAQRQKQVKVRESTGLSQSANLLVSKQRSLGSTEFYVETSANFVTNFIYVV
jgi:hypothetical protein